MAGFDDLAFDWLVSTADPVPFQASVDGFTAFYQELLRGGDLSASVDSMTVASKHTGWQHTAFGAVQDAINAVNYAT